MIHTVAQPTLSAWRGVLREHEPLSHYTTWRVGGPADRLYCPADREDLIAFLRTLPDDEPLLWLGLGSNLLVRDGGWRGTVIHTHGCLRRIEELPDGRLYVEAGVACARVARYTAQLGLGGAAFLAGIPGTLGGALKMNAGAFGGETWQCVESVETIDARGVVRRRGRQEFGIAYRSVVMPRPGEWFLAAYLYLSPTGENEDSQAKIRELLARRQATQPIQQATCGSVFKNPPGDFAARLIESCGLKGRRCGDAVVSEKHANFIVNDGAATAADIEALIELVKQTVCQRHGVLLETEVCMIGERAYP